MKCVRATLRLSLRVMALVALGGVAGLVLLRLLSPLAGHGQEAVAWLLSRYLDQPVRVSALRLDWRGWQPRLQLDGLRVGPAVAPLAKGVRLRARLDLAASVMGGRPIWSQVEVRGATLTIPRVGLPRSTKAAALPVWLNRLFTIRTLDVEFKRVTVQGQGPSGSLRLGRDLLLKSQPAHGERRLIGSLTGPDGSQRLHLVAGLRGVPERRSSWQAGFELQGWGLQPALWPLPARLRPVAGRLDVTLAGHWRPSGVSKLHASGRIQAPIPPDRPAYAALTRWLARLPQWRYALSGHGRNDRWHWRLALTGRDRQGAVHKTSVLRLISDAGHWRGRLDRLQVQQLVALVTPWLTPAARTTLTGLGPRGALQELNFSYRPVDQELHLQGRFTDLGSRKWRSVPAITGLTGRFRWTGSGGELQLDRKAVTVHSSWLAAPVRLNRFGGTLRWHATRDGWRLDPNLSLANADLHARVRGSVRFTAGRSPLFDLRTAFHDVDVARIPVYLPAGLLHPELLGWLKQALAAGRVATGHALLHGRSDDFPFTDGGGRFQVRCQVTGMRFSYAPGWPPIKDLNAELLFYGRSLTITADQGRILDARLRTVRATIVDLADATVNVNGAVRGSAKGMLDFVRRSPLKSGLGTRLDGLQATGPSTLDLRLIIPLGDDHHNRVSGTLRLADDILTVPRRGLTFTAVRGSVDFSNDRVYAKGLRLRLHGEPLTVQLRSTADSVLQARATGQLSLARLSGYGTAATAAYVSGRSRWNIQFDLLPGDRRRFRLRLDSNLQGTRIALPVPLGKTAVAMRSARVVIDGSEGLATDVEFIYGDAVQGNVQIGSQNTLNHLTAQISGLSLARQRLGPVTLQIQHSAGRYDAQFNGPDLFGRLRWPRAPGQPLRVALQRLRLFNGDTATSRSAPGWAAFELTPQALPPLELSVANLWLGGYRYGRLALSGVPVAQGYALQALALSGPAYTVQAHGTWRKANRDAATRLQIDAHSKALGTTLSAVGVPVKLLHAPADARLRLRWAGGPQAMSWSALTGTLKLTIGGGRLTQVNPGLGKLLGLFSLDSLGRRLQLDFSDLAKSGLAFDSVTGRAGLGGGKAAIERLQLTGPALGIRVNGHVGLARRDLDLTATITPQLGMPLAIAGTLAGGPVLGASMLLADKVLKPGFQGLLNLRYAITGSWRQPRVKLLQAPSARRAPAGGRK